MAVVLPASATWARTEENGPQQINVDQRTIRKLGVDPRIVNLYEVIDFRYTGGMFHDEPFHCGIIKPYSTVAHEKYPLVVWMAGIGPEELDEQAAIGHLRWLEQMFDAGNWASEKRPCYVLVMKIKSIKGKWFDRYGNPPPANANDPGDEQVSVLHELITKVLADYPIDREKVYLMGVSAGGTACFEMAMRYPELFAAMVPMATEGGDLSRVERIAGIPTWAFHATGDHPEKIRATIAALKNAGGVARLTEIDGEEHNCWTPAASHYDIFAWLFAQRRGHWSYPPGFSPLPWWNWLALGAIVAAGYLVWHFRRKTRPATAAPAKNWY